MENSQLIEKNNDIDLLGEKMSSIYVGTLSENTKKAYIKDLKDFFGVNDLKNIKIKDILQVNTASANIFREKLRQKGLKPSTINRKLTSLSSFFSFLSRKEIGLISYNPFSPREGAIRLKQNRRYSNTRCLTKQEIQSMIKVTMQKDDLVSLRNRIIVLLLATTGMRRSEIANIKIGDMKKMEDKNVIEIIGKGDKERLIVISDTIKTFIDKYLELRNLTYNDKNEYLLVNHSYNPKFSGMDKLTSQTIYNVIKSIAEEAGLDASNISPHCLRHSFATESLEMGLPIQDVQDLMGHADISTTRRYDHTRRILKNNPSQMLENILLGKQN